MIIGGTEVSFANGAWSWCAGLAVDADGCPNAYAPPGAGLQPLDSLANAYRPGRWLDPDGKPVIDLAIVEELKDHVECWLHDPTAPFDAEGYRWQVGKCWGLVCDSDGEPVIQGPDDPEPGYYISPTAYGDPAKAITDPRRYVDGSRIPYLSVPPELRAAGVRLGDLARVTYRDHWSPALVADVGPHGKIGEGSPALARPLGLNASAIHGGTGKGVAVTLWPRTSLGWPIVMDRIEARVAQLWAARAAVLQSGTAAI